MEVTTRKRRQVAAAGAVAVGAGLVASITGAASPAQAAAPRMCPPDVTYDTWGFTDGFFPKGTVSGIGSGGQILSVQITKGTTFTTQAGTTTNTGLSISPFGIGISAQVATNHAVSYAYTVSSTYGVSQQVPAGKHMRLYAGFYTKNYQWKAEVQNGNCQGTRVGARGTATSPVGPGYKLYPASA